MLASVRMSACIPAPPLGSEAAKVSTIGGKSAVGSAVEDIGSEGPWKRRGAKAGQTKVRAAGGDVGTGTSARQSGPDELDRIRFYSIRTFPRSDEEIHVPDLRPHLR